MKKTVGDLLREARNQKGLALQTISKEIGVSDHHLLAIELDQFTLIPEEELDGFLARYAQAVDLDFTELKQLLESQGGEAPASVFNEEVGESIDEEFLLTLDNLDDEETGYRRSRRQTKEKEDNQRSRLPQVLLGLVVVLILAAVCWNFRKSPLLANLLKSTEQSSVKEEVVEEQIEEPEVAVTPEVKLMSQPEGEQGDEMSVKITGTSAPVTLEISFDGTSTGMGQSWIGLTNVKSETEAIMLDSGSTYTDELLQDGKEVELNFGITEGISIKIAGEDLDMSPITSRSYSTIKLIVE